MKNSEFRDWLKGFFELSAPDTALTAAQVQVIINHLNLAEAVEGKLDAANASLREEILSFRNAGDLDAGNGRLLADSLRERLLGGE